jgi:hypothetical protein
MAGGLAREVEGEPGEDGASRKPRRVAAGRLDGKQIRAEEPTVRWTGQDTRRGTMSRTEERMLGWGIELGVERRWERGPWEGRSGTASLHADWSAPQSSATRLVSM